MSGIAAASTGIGIAGVAPDARILPVKALDEEGGSFEDIAMARKPGTDLRGVYDSVYGSGIVDANAAVAARRG